MPELFCSARRAFAAVSLNNNSTMSKKKKKQSGRSKAKKAGSSKKKEEELGTLDEQMEQLKIAAGDNSQADDEACMPAGRL